MSARPLLTDAARPATLTPSSPSTSAARRCADADRRRTSADAVPRQTRDRDADDARRRARLIAIGHLRNQRLVERLEDIAAVQVDNGRRIRWPSPPLGLHRRPRRTHGPGAPSPPAAARHDVRRPAGRDRGVSLPRVACLDGATLHGLLDAGCATTVDHKQAGAVMAAPWRAAPGALMFVEDIGRHNAVDAIAGRINGWKASTRQTRSSTPPAGSPPEMVIKTAGGVPFLVSRSGLTQMG
ncbi:MAG: formate dehydrogenase accessory sulfurtransferase FdhD [Rhodocyclales bacterium]|nr:formate dehydrogenase accessory sulfurtransferase FdhD [Rhodocyclales bacterium]